MPRKGMVYFGLDLPEADLAVVREVAEEADRPAGYVIRRILDSWIASDPKLSKRRAALQSGTQKDAASAPTGATTLRHRRRPA
jgi:hypothetical protein